MTMVAAAAVTTLAAPAPANATTSAHRTSRHAWYETHNGARAYARRQTRQRQFNCLDSLWKRESSWRVHAHNPSSGAYGIPQANPGSKMGSAGSDWRSNGHTQVSWGLHYIRQQYGTPCRAWSHSQHTGWY